MNRIKLVILSFMMVVVFIGCTHTEKVRAVTEGALRPADSVGTIEVHIKTNPWHPSNWGSFFKEFFTLTFADTSYATRLKKKLVKESDKFSAQEVVNVVFWPDLNLSQFPEGKVHARGEMVRYRRFASQS